MDDAKLFFQELRIASEDRLAKLAKIPREKIDSSTNGGQSDQFFYEQKSTAKASTSELEVKFDFFYELGSLKKSILDNNSIFESDELDDFAPEFVNVMVGIINGAIEKSKLAGERTIPQSLANSEMDDCWSATAGYSYWKILIDDESFLCKVSLEAKSQLALHSISILDQPEQMIKLPKD